MILFVRSRRLELTATLIVSINMNRLIIFLFPLQNHHKMNKSNNSQQVNCKEDKEEIVSEQLNIINSHNNNNSSQMSMLKNKIPIMKMPIL